MSLRSYCRYLGVQFKNVSKFSCNWSDARCNFYKALNGILAGLGQNPCINVALALFRAFCIPVLCYGKSYMSLSVSNTRSLCFAYNNIFSRLFKSRNSEIVDQCQFYCGFFPFQSLYDYNRYSFLVNLYNKGSINAVSLFCKLDYVDLCNLAIKYNFNISDSKRCLQFKIWKYLESSLI